MQSFKFISFIFFILIGYNGMTQTDTSGVWVGYLIENGDTLLVSVTPEANVISYSDSYYRESRKYKKALRRVKKVYPYAMLASSMYEDYMVKIDEFEKNKERRKYLKEEEKALKEKFEGKIRDISVLEGVILIKLIDRQTSHTSYEVLKEIRGGGSALLWQGVARIFNSSLKHQYDPNGEDWMIEEIVQRIRTGDVDVSELNMSMN
tara:strand:+ start:99651 stop:100268 length:618 start_codon:yes stop_codon:yes gene_type:complete